MASKQAEDERHRIEHWETMARLLVQTFEQANAGSVAYDMTAEYSARRDADASQHDAAPPPPPQSSS
jgi:hypothetical protein